jgi:hypothetical protein
LNEEQEEAISWLVTPEHLPVLDASGEQAGTVEAMLGDDEDDIFHGVAVNRKGVLAGTVELLAARVTRITTKAIYTDLQPDEADELEKFEAEPWYEFRGKGRFKRVKWKEDE